MIAFATLAQMESGSTGMPFLTRLGSVAPIGLSFLALAVLGLVLLSNRVIRRRVEVVDG
jgi:hypothetical protein